MTTLQDLQVAAYQLRALAEHWDGVAHAFTGNWSGGRNSGTPFFRPLDADFEGGHAALVDMRLGPQKINGQIALNAFGDKIRAAGRDYLRNEAELAGLSAEIGRVLQEAGL